MSSGNPLMSGISFQKEHLQKSLEINKFHLTYSACSSIFPGQFRTPSCYTIRASHIYQASAAGTEGHELSASISHGTLSKLEVLLGLALSVKAGPGSNNVYAPLMLILSHRLATFCTSDPTLTVLDTALTQSQFLRFVLFLIL